MEFARLLPETYANQLKIPDLVDKGLDYEDTDVVALVIGGVDEETGPARVVAEGRADKLFAVPEDDLHLPALWLFPVAELAAFIIGRVPVKVLYEEDCLEVLDQYLLGILARGFLLGLQVEPVLVWEEILSIPLDHLSVCIPDDYFHSIHGHPRVLISNMERQAGLHF